MTSVDSALMQQHWVVREARRNLSNTRWSYQQVERELTELRRVETSGVGAIQKDSWVFKQGTTIYPRLDEIRRLVDELLSPPAGAAHASRPADQTQREIDTLQAEGRQIAAEAARAISPKRDVAKRAFEAAEAAAERAKADDEVLGRAEAQLREMERELRIQTWVRDGLQQLAREQASASGTGENLRGPCRVFVLGAVGKPGKILFEPHERPSVVMAISHAGGLATADRRTVTRLIRRNADATHSVQELPTSKTSEGSDVFGVLSDQDIVVVAEAAAVVRPGQATVVGAVNAPGIVRLFDDRPTRIVDAINQADGVNRLALLRRTKVTRVDPVSGVKKVTTLNLDPFYRREKLGDAGFVLEPGDVVYVSEVVGL